ncbi:MULTISPECIES: DUF6173 family protein [Proteus]|uniref:DUF6173 family protein n=1 Tax=Proteus TaxID=583 RepID=UPI001F34CF8A|nr:MULTISPECIES: DUF6173 family protein [Proteus]
MKIRIPNSELLNISNPSLQIPDHDLASGFQRRVLTLVNDFHRELSDDFEVGGQLVSFGKTIEFSFTSVGFWNPALISFSGMLDDGSPIELVQHISQINILLVRKKREAPSEPKRPIGFAKWEEYDAFVGEQD